MTDSHDPWESARGAQKEEVAAIWAGRGAPPEERARRRRGVPWRFLAVVAVALAVIGVAISVLSADGAEDRRDASAAQERLEARERARLIREGKPVFAEGPAPLGSESELTYRVRLLAAAEAAITADAIRRTETGEIDRDVKGTRCKPFPYTSTRAAQERDASLARNRYQCIAYNNRFSLSELEGEARTGIIGQPYWLIADYETGKLTFCKLTPKAGEGGKSLVDGAGGAGLPRPARLIRRRRDRGPRPAGSFPRGRGSSTSTCPSPETAARR